MLSKSSKIQQTLKHLKYNMPHAQTDEMMILLSNQSKWFNNDIWELNWKKFIIKSFDQSRVHHGQKSYKSVFWDDTSRHELLRNAAY